MFVPVISKTGKQLMPCHPARARKLVRKGLARRRFKAGIFYIQLTQRIDGETQDIAVGIDPGSKREAFTVKSESHTYINILSNAVTWVKDSMEVRKNMRRTRRSRNTPYRKCRCNRSVSEDRLSPSTKARWQAKLRILDILLKIYPIKFVVVEDVKAKSWKNAKKWNTNFSPLEVGKNWFYQEIRNKGLHLDLKAGYETFELRNQMNLKKTKNKMSETFDAHNVDSWVLANWKIGGHTKPDMLSLVKMEPIQFHRRQLHRLQFAKDGIRKNYGSTLSLGFKRGSLVKHKKYGITYIGGCSKRGISLHNIESGNRVYRTAKVKDLVKLCFNYWRITAIPLCAKASQSPCC